MKIPMLKTRDGLVEAEAGCTYWMRFPKCAWDVVRIGFECGEWRILFMDSRNERLDFEFKDAEFVEIQAPQDLPVKTQKDGSLLLQATREDGFNRVGFYTKVCITDSKTNSVWVSAMKNGTCFSEEFVAEKVSLSVSKEGRS